MTIKSMTATIKEVAAYLERVGLQYMATIGLDGKPKVRPALWQQIGERRDTDGLDSAKCRGSV